MSSAKGDAAFEFTIKMHDRVESFVLESLDIKSGKSGQESRQGLPASGFRPKVRSHAECLSLESMDISCGESGHESRQGSRRLRIYNQTA